MEVSVMDDMIIILILILLIIIYIKKVTAYSAK